MYHNGQVVHHVPTNRPVVVGGPDDFAWAIEGTKDTIHYIQRNPRYEVIPSVPVFAGGLPQIIQVNGNEYRYADYHREQQYSVALPKTVEEAALLLAEGKIRPAPL